jgi:F-type H+-transporting ATPase subunit delta
MTRKSQVARRYAQALAATLDDSALEVAASPLRTLAELASSHAELRAILANPAIPAPRRTELVLALARQLDAPPKLLRVLERMGRNDRLGMLAELSEIFEEIKDERTGRLRAEVTAARPLGGIQREKIEGALARMTGRQVEITERIDSGLIGGVVTRVGSTIYDGSLKNRLAGLRERILRSS